ncbi:hypothetical protein [Saccharopolyspora shandongensis]|uniref:hypothetical protein n=1 Tax=Saccharopolyspora shandongensis TaxID=418495 RepID=UPI0033CBEA09
MAQVRLADKPPYGAVRTSTKGNAAGPEEHGGATFKINNVSPVFIESRWPVVTSTASRSAAALLVLEGHLIPLYICLGQWS